MPDRNSASINQGAYNNSLITILDGFQQSVWSYGPLHPSTETVIIWCARLYHPLVHCIFVWTSAGNKNRGQSLRLVHINAGVPQGTLFGPVGFIVHINDLRTCVPTYKCVDDSTLWEVCSVRALDSQLQRATDEAVRWSAENHMLVNCGKTRELQVCCARSKPALLPSTIDDKAIERVPTANFWVWHSAVT